MNKRRRLALIAGLVLPLVVVPLLVISTPDLCSAGPLERLRGFYAYYNKVPGGIMPNYANIEDYAAIGILSIILLAYSFDWFRKIKSTSRSLFIFLGIIIAELLVLATIYIAVGLHCWTF